MSRQVNILALVPDAWGGRGGVAQYNRDFLGTLRRCRGIGQITVAVRLQPDPASPPQGIVQTRVRRAASRYALSALWTALRRPVDVVFCGHVNMAPLALFIARLRRARLVVQAHGVEVWSEPPALRRWAVDRADLLLGVSRHTRASIAAWSTLAPERLIVVPNTVGEAFAPGEGDELKASLNLGGKRVLLTVGRMVAHEQEKGHHRVIALLPALVRAGHDVAYVVIGEGDDRARLEALAQVAGVTDRLVFLGGAPTATTIEAYRMADLFMMPSRQEGFGIAFLESMACGTPAVGLPVGGTVDALGDGELGLLADEHELAAVVDQALRRPRPNRQALSDAVRRRFGQPIFEQATAAFAQRIHELVEGKPPAGTAQGVQA